MESAGIFPRVGDSAQRSTLTSYFCSLAVIHWMSEPGPATLTLWTTSELALRSKFCPARKRPVRSFAIAEASEFPPFGNGDEGSAPLDHPHLSSLRASLDVTS